MLSLKAMLATHQQLPTIVFDEIDTGVSGKMAESMARMMQQMAMHCQVICITHLPQIAAMADNHFVIEKSSTDAGASENVSTITDIRRLEEEESMAKILLEKTGEAKATNQCFKLYLPLGVEDVNEEKDSNMLIVKFDLPSVLKCFRDYSKDDEWENGLNKFVYSIQFTTKQNFNSKTKRKQKKKQRNKNKCYK